MGEKNSFGKSGRNEGYKPAGRSGRTADSRGANFGAAPHSSSFGAARSANSGASRGADLGTARGANSVVARSGKVDSTANFRSRKPIVTESESKTADFRGNKIKSQDSGGYERNRSLDGGGYDKSRSQGSGGFGKSKSLDGTGFNRNRSQDGAGYKDAPRTEKAQGFGSTAFRGERKGSGYKHNDRPYSHNDTQSKRDEMQDNRDFAVEDQIKEFQGDLDKLEGRNSVLEALKSGRSINKIFVAKGDRDGSISQVIAMARQSHIIIQEIDRAKLDAMSMTHSHQGVIALTAAKDYVEVDDILASAVASGRPPFIIILDEITDSYNLGSILRTANAAGVHGVIIPKRRAVGLTSIVSKASAGAIEYVPVARVTNIVQTIENLKKQNIWVVGTDMSGEKPYFERDLTGAIALVIGSEGEGMGKLVRESCDFVVNIPMLGQISSLNAAVAGAIVTYEILRQRSKRQS